MFNARAERSTAFSGDLFRNVAVASSILWFDEIQKLVLRRQEGRN